ncbi:MAG: ABC transporter permease [Geminicoccaceae bacterium]|nr:ABC transporter permease [Geminicoccaceae bacterium]MCS7268663.1 ABC transporter permease [Geminicoccaceae bacterium]MDW8124726.1 ABC transporter permease [Geminicoccaceae bacterium]
MIVEALRLALRALARNPLRSFLTVLGIVIGVGAVIAMVTIGRGTQARVTADLARLGTNVLFLLPGQVGPGRATVAARPFTDRDVQAIREQVGGLEAVAPVAHLPATATFAGASRITTITGTDNALFAVQDWKLASGRFFTEGEVRSGRTACILGATVKDALFGAEDPIEKTIRVKKVPCEVVGVLESKGQSSFGTDLDDTVVMPLRAFQRRLSGNTEIPRIYVAAREGADTARIQAELERLLRERRGIRPGEEDDFSVRDMRELVRTVEATSGALTAVLGFVAAVSLIVGGIGIMNIMLVSVTERTREIGIRLAIGALEGQVMAQFLIEAVVLSGVGGAIGVILGLAVAGATTEALAVPFRIDPEVVAGSFLFSAAIGVLFGWLPARRAARLDPIEALRRE